MIESLQRKATRDASVTDILNGYRMTIPAGDARHYRLAELDDYTHLPRKRFPAQAPLTLSLRARASAPSLPGTWGFGLWNDPFGISLGFGGNRLRLPTLPNAIWFFHASPENYLSFGDKPGNGFLAQAFRSPKLPIGKLGKVGLTLPFSPSKARALMSKIVEEDCIHLDVNVTEWHSYRFEWHPARSAFWVDNTLVLETSLSPRPPLGLVIWIDNQYAAWKRDGSLKWGMQASDEAWLEVAEIEI